MFTCNDFLSSVFYMANGNSRKFKQNQIIFCIQPWFVEYSRHIVFGEDRLRERGSLPATFLLPYSLRNGSMVMAKKIVFEIIADPDSTTLKTWKKVVFRKVSVCVCVCVSVCVCVCVCVCRFFLLSPCFHFLMEHGSKNNRQNTTRQTNEC